MTAMSDSNAARYGHYQRMKVEVSDDGIALLTLNNPAKLNAVDEIAHQEACHIWLDLDKDPRVKVIVITGEGKAFSAGGDLTMIDKAFQNNEYLLRMYEEARGIVHNMVQCDKVIISAINGVAVGAGCALALMADISIASEKARFNDGHIRLGVAAGDHAVMLWPLLCGMAKAKYYILTGKFVEAAEAERIGLVSKTVPHGQLMEEAMGVALAVATGPQHAIKYSKRSLNVWLKQNGGGAFDLSCALEMLSFTSADPKEGRAALGEKRTPAFPSASKL